eukprot:gb/GECG01016829.1/.p1 GENE.gb/GECG01016829.1/~~gb/GECG01016829.1/.p1  ORF type:complete len:1242 (+),score=202.80 gb/GECG01016829.1/:1-3726(+)
MPDTTNKNKNEEPPAHLVAEKIVRKLERARLRETRPSVSFEFFPAKTEAGVNNLLSRIQDMSFRLQPTFVTLTWQSHFKDESVWLNIGSKVQQHFGVDTLLHLTCHLPKEDLKRILNNARKAGIRNILALRGDPPIRASVYNSGESTSSTAKPVWRTVPGGLKNALELVELIRAEHGDYFCIAVAGYPEVHTENWNDLHLPPSEQAQIRDLERLKMKVDAGADFVLTQFFFDLDIFFDFERRCREMGIHVPIVPSCMPVQTYRSFCQFTRWCRTRVPSKVLKDIESIRGNDEAVREYGIRLGTDLCRRLLDHGYYAIHFYTMNLNEAVSRILENLDMIPKPHERPMPWMMGPGDASSKRPQEEVRPIFWVKRAASYLSRTANWREFPNGRWGDARSPAYGELTDYYLAAKRPTVDRKKMWGVPKTETDIRNIFVKYVDEEVHELPWCDTKITAESKVIIDDLRWLNMNGFLTINSQPKVNGAPSSDPTVGWGGKDGYVFQKAYVEFFCSPELFTKLLNYLPHYPTLTYHATNCEGLEYSNAAESRANAVTWGVFPGREIIQPTVVDPASFRAWKDEAFELWNSQWGATYDPNDPEESKAISLIDGIRQNYWLVNLVDNAYADQDSDIFRIFKDLVTNSLNTRELREMVQNLQSENRQLRRKVTKLEEINAYSTEEIREIVERAARAESENASLRMLLKRRNALQELDEDKAPSAVTLPPRVEPVSGESANEAPDESAGSPYVATDPELNVEPMPESRRYSIEQSREKLERSRADSLGEPKDEDGTSNAQISMRSGMKRVHYGLKGVSPESSASQVDPVSKKEYAPLSEKYSEGAASHSKGSSRVSYGLKGFQTKEREPKKRENDKYFKNEGWGVTTAMKTEDSGKPTRERHVSFSEDQEVTEEKDSVADDQDKMKTLSAKSAPESLDDKQHFSTAATADKGGSKRVSYGLKGFGASESTSATSSGASDQEKIKTLNAKAAPESLDDQQHFATGAKAQKGGSTRVSYGLKGFGASNTTSSNNKEPSDQDKISNLSAKAAPDSLSDQAHFSGASKEERGGSKRVSFGLKGFGGSNKGEKPEPSDQDKMKNLNAKSAPESLDDEQHFAGAFKDNKGGSKRVSYGLKGFGGGSSESQEKSGNSDQDKMKNLNAKAAPDSLGDKQHFSGASKDEKGGSKRVSYGLKGFGGNTSKSDKNEGSSDQDKMKNLNAKDAPDTLGDQTHFSKATKTEKEGSKRVSYGLKGF